MKQNPQRELANVLAESQRLVALAGRGLARVEFLRACSGILLGLSDCDALQIESRDDEIAYSWEADRGDNASASTAQGEAPLGRTSFQILKPGGRKTAGSSAPISPAYRSHITLPINDGEHCIGQLVLLSKSKDHFSADAVGYFEFVVSMLGLAITNRRAQARLAERIKELDCLYDIARIVRVPNRTLDEKLADVTARLPSAWQFPEIAGARLLLGERRFVEGNRSAAVAVQSASISAFNESTGVVEVFYTSERPEFVEGPFLREETSLLEGVALEIGELMERTRDAEQRARLEDQLRHADRLATIGQLASGVAHELNEPLANILGFAQLIQKSPTLDEQVQRDLQHVVYATLHGREIIQSLLLYARQTPAARSPVDLSVVASEAISLLQARCEKNGIALKREFARSGTVVSGDAGQLKQVIVNLAVNAIHAMQSGGTLTVRTELDTVSDRVRLTVSDTGIGMSEEIRRRIFEPFFTTKDVGMGTGLGLAVVDGIVARHGGDIVVESNPGEGATFVVTLPRSINIVENEKGLDVRATS
ncbi:MAG: hypothetical protein KF841_00800 [Phycisphaerae bacterium]|nr:hypothetical protein [Phycisphaerae bacterium]